MTARLAYHHRLADYGSLDFELHYYYSSKAAEADYAELSYSLVNARVSWNSVMGKPIDLSVFAKTCSTRIILPSAARRARASGSSEASTSRPANMASNSAIISGADLTDGEGAVCRTGGSRLDLGKDAYWRRWLRFVNRHL